MNYSGDAAEQVVRISLEGTEFALRMSGAAAKNVAAALYTVAKNYDGNKISGHQRLKSMLKSGKELKVFTISEENLKIFTQEAKRYGVVYCALRGKEKTDDGMVDIMVRSEDASKINRIVERFSLTTVDAATIKHDILQKCEERQQNPTQGREERDRPSDPNSRTQSTVGDSFTEPRKSVRAELAEIKESRKKQTEVPQKSPSREQPVHHKSPANKKIKER